MKRLFILVLSTLLGATAFAADQSANSGYQEASRYMAASHGARQQSAQSKKKKKKKKKASAHKPKGKKKHRKTTRAA